MTPFVHADALVSMWSAYDRSEPDGHGLRLHRGRASTIAFIESLAVVMAMSRIAVSKGVLSDDEGKESAR